MSLTWKLILGFLFALVLQVAQMLTSSYFTVRVVDASTQVSNGLTASLAVQSGLDAAHTLVMVLSICGNGAYNYFTKALIIPNSGTPVAVAKFNAPSIMGEPGNADPGLVNASYDAKTRRLATYAKGCGLGDCGMTQQFAWDASRFRLVEQSEIGECRGSVDYIRTWRAAVR
jgi:hypothetical protein